ncbi:MAG: pyruvate kinase [Gammaproteobacteria bacterium]|nr:pyruvate kinase [Gammaproteobacteria bacterium]
MAEVIDIERVSAQLESICERALDSESRHAAELAAVHPSFRHSAKNLVHYIALRQTDIRALQEDLSALGLSSLGQAERNVMASIRAVQSALQTLTGDPRNEHGEDRRVFELQNRDADTHKTAILGKCPGDRNVGIMVTLPTEAGSDLSLLEEMIAAGLNIARINCAHDDERVWAAMIDNVKRASEEAGTECKILMDLAGPKIRTGELLPGPRVLHIKPRRDPLGRIIAPRRIRLIPDDVVWRGTKAAVVPVPREMIEHAQVGDDIRFRDTRGKKRQLNVIQKDAKGLVVEISKGAYIETGSKLCLYSEEQGEKLTYGVGQLPAIEQPILLRPGDTLILDGDGTPGAPAVEDGEGDVLEFAHISCRQPEVFEFVAVDDRVSLNDGKIGGVVRSLHDDRLEIEIIKAKPTGSRLRADRGVNFPDTDIRLPGLTAADRSNLEFVIKHADAVGLSFVRRPADIIALHEEMERLGDGEHGLVLKIENKKAFNCLPHLLLTAMRRYPVAVMIARGDLAVECGWERLAELQEEILWLCEAAQVPVIWATQVLERKAKTGQPSRAEISDAAMSQRADCVMLNKGPHIIATIRMLDDILRRMQAHQYKKTAHLGKLDFPDDPPEND